jgi:hypothetical protein
MKVVTCNRAFFATFREKPEDTVGQSLHCLGDGRWDHAQLRERLEGVLGHDSSFDDLRLAMDSPGLGHRSMLLNARRIERESVMLSAGDGTQPGTNLLILLAIADVSEQTLADDLESRGDLLEGEVHIGKPFTQAALQQAIRDVLRDERAP